jgi:hypothetical protein
MAMPEQDQNITPTENVGRGFILRSTLPAQWAVSQPHQLEVSAQDIRPGRPWRIGRKGYGDVCLYRCTVGELEGCLSTGDFER